MVVPYPPLAPSPRRRGMRTRARCETVCGQLLNFQSPSFPKMSCLFHLDPLSRLPRPLFPARPSLSLFSLCVSVPLHTLLLQTPSAFSPRSLQLLPCPQSQFFLFCSGSAQYRTAQIPKTLSLPILAALPAATASSFPPLWSTKHQAQRRPWSAQKHEKPSKSISSATVCARLYGVWSVLVYVPCAVHPPPRTPVPLYPCTHRPLPPCTLVPVYPVPMYPFRETRRTTKYVCVASPPPSPSHPHHLEFVSNSSLLPFPHPPSRRHEPIDSNPPPSPCPSRACIYGILRISITALSLSVSD